MKAMILENVHDTRSTREPLRLVEIERPEPAPGEVLVKVTACGVCHTELDEIEGRTPPPVYPVIPGHEVVGVVESIREGTGRLREGDRVGMGWIGHACGTCRFCTTGRENLCPEFRALGRDMNGGYAEYVVIAEEFATPVPDGPRDAEAAVLLCAGAVGLRSLRLARLENGRPLGLTGFGASGHLVLQMSRHLYPRSPVIVFARSEAERRFALELGAAWAGDTDDIPPEPPQAIIDTTPAWKPVLAALERLDAGGRLVINAIRKEEGDRKILDRLNYTTHLWMEKEVASVANVTRRDIADCLALAPQIPLKPEVVEFPLEEANRALMELKDRKIRGGKVLRP